MQQSVYAHQQLDQCSPVFPAHLEVIASDQR